MAGIDTGGGHGTKKAVNQEIPLVPFIDFLLCCVMFLLVTAVWNQLAAVRATPQVGDHDHAVEPNPDVVRRLRIDPRGYELVVGDAPAERIERAGERYDLARLTATLERLHMQEPGRDDLVLEASDGVAYADIVDAMDATFGVGLLGVELSPWSTTR